MSAPDVITLGETMAVLSNPRVGPLRHAHSLELSSAGAESNLAIGLARLGHRAAWIGRVGEDEFGLMIRRNLAAEGVDTRAVSVDSTAATGLMVKSRRTNALTRVTYYRSGSAGSRLCADDVDAPLVQSARLLHLTGITPALSQSARTATRYAVKVARSAGLTVSIDINYRRALWSAQSAAKELRELVQQADVVFATEAEARLLVDAPDVEGLAQELAGLGPKQVLVKRGQLGALAYVDGQILPVPAIRVQEVDPVGAGDAFAAGYLSGLLNGEPVTNRLATAALAGAFAVTVAGDWEGLPDRAELAMMAAQTAGGDSVQR